MSLLEELRRDLVLANRILYDQQIVDGLGHISVRHPDDPSLFLLSVNRAPALVRRQDIAVYRLDGTAVDPDSPRPYLEMAWSAHLQRCC